MWLRMLILKHPAFRHPRCMPNMHCWQLIMICSLLRLLGGASPA